MTDGWDLIANAVGQALPFLIALGPVILGYYLNEFAKRRAFAREKKYDNVRKGFQNILSSLRAYRAAADAAGYILDVQVRHFQDKSSPEIKPLVHGLLLSAIAFSRFNTQEDVTRLEPLMAIPLPERTQEWFGRVVDAMMTSVSRQWAVAETAIQEAVSEVFLLGSEGLVLERVKEIEKRLGNELHGLSVTMGKFLETTGETLVEWPKTEEGWFEVELTKLHAVMRAELAEIIGPQRARARLT